LSLLQARPIRGLEIVRDIEQCRVDEITRLKTLAGNRRRVWVAHNLGETLPAPTPLTWDVIRGFMSGMGGYGRMYKDFGYRPSARVSKEGLLELICGRIYADPDRVAELFWEHMPMEYDPDAILKNAGELEAPPGRFNPEKADGSFLLSFPGTLLAMLKSSRTMKRLRRNTVERFEKEILPPYLAYLETCRAMDLTRLSTAEVLKELETRRTRVMDEFANQSLQPGFFGGMARARLEQILVQLMGVSEGRKLALELTTGLDNDLTLEQNDCLYQVARGEKTLDQFLEKFGHRAVGEMELAEPRWRADASYLDKIVAGHKQGEGVRPAARHEENAHRRHQAEAALPELLAKFGGSSMREEIQAELNDAQRMLPYRENGKFYLMKGYAEIREALLELSRRWDLGRDLFFLHWEELARFETDRPALEKEINKRKIRWQAARKLEMPEVIDSSALDTLGKPRVYETAQELKGDCISAGVFTGPARIVYHPQEARELGTGFILVCPSTDPGWTALFMHARGLVIERGGVLSHGAIVARDFGIPAVVCPEATRRIPEGAMVRVDGNRGLVTVVENGN
jgi:pyruvate,water dikinase